MTLASKLGTSRAALVKGSKARGKARLKGTKRRGKAGLKGSKRKGKAGLKGRKTSPRARMQRAGSWPRMMWQRVKRREETKRTSLLKLLKVVPLLLTMALPLICCYPCPNP